MKPNEVKKLYTLCEEHNNIKIVMYDKDNLENWYKEMCNELNRVEREIELFIYEFQSLSSYSDIEWNIIYSIIWHEHFIVIAPYSNSPLVDIYIR